MGFFKDLKDDFSQAVNELIPEDDVEITDNSDQMVNTLDSEVSTSNEEAEIEMKEWLEGFMQEDTTESIPDEETKDDTLEDTSLDDNLVDEGILDDSLSDDDIYEVDSQEEILEEGMEGEIEDMAKKVDYSVDENLVANVDEVENVDLDEFDENVDLELLDALNAEEQEETEEASKPEKKVRAASVAIEDDVTVISKGTTINGSVSSDGSLDIMGSITGDVECLGKLSITGKIVGNSTAAEVYINTERLEGSINSEGSVKVGLGTVVVGDIVATSGVIAGAVKGEIDINGPIVIDSTAIIKGNIKAKSVQINNGAVVEGFCSLSYSDVDLENVFE
jgi:cytoskeletal protein CcmA (bactofilin family)